MSRIDEGGDTVGEGQAYGMLIAAAAGDSQRFDQIWNWTKQNLRRDDGLISFKWRDGKIEDPEAASDADIDAARALLVASCRFNQPDKRQEALELGETIRDKETAEVEREPGAHRRAVGQQRAPDHQPQLLLTGHLRGAGQGLGRRRRVGQPVGQLPDDHRPADDRLLAAAAGLGEARGRQADADRHARPTPAATPKFSFDAPRTLVRFAEDPDQSGREIAARAWPVFEGQDPNEIVVERDLAGKPTGGTKHPIVLVAAAGAADAAGKDDERDKLLNAASALDQNSSTYYGSAWVAIGRYMLQTDALDGC